jgi:flagellar assembly factor FliW
MANCETKYWGKLEYADDAPIDFPAGIPGFEQERRFVLIGQRTLDPLVFLQSLTTPSLCFLALNVRIVSPGYTLRISDEDLLTLGLAGRHQPPIGPDLACLAVVHFDENEITANLLAPIVIHIPGRRGAQAIQAGSDYSIQHRIELVEAPVCV